MQLTKWVTLGFGALCLVIVAAVLRADHLYIMAGILITLPGISYLLGWLALRDLKFERELPSLAWEGEAARIGYRVYNPTRIARFFLSIHEHTPGWMQFVDPRSPLFNVAAEDSTHFERPLIFRRRGVYRISAFDVTAVDPLGVFAFTQRVPASGEQVVFPAPRRIESFSLSAAERNGWQEWTESALNGDSVSPDGVREYRDGDSLRRVHWRQTARTGRLSVIEFEQDRSVALRIVLDAYKLTSRPEEIDTPLEYLIRFAATALHLATQQGAANSLAVAGVEAEEDSEGLTAMAGRMARGEDHYFETLHLLARVEPGSKDDFTEALEAQAADRSVGTTLLVLTSRLTPQIMTTIKRLQVSGNRILFVYCNPHSFPNRPRSGNATKAESDLAELASSGVMAASLEYDESGALIPVMVRQGNMNA